jgi:hypothetical protein
MVADESTIVIEDVATTEAVLDAANELVDTMDHAFAEMTCCLEQASSSAPKKEVEINVTDGGSGDSGGSGISEIMDTSEAFESLGPGAFIDAINGRQDEKKDNDLAEAAENYNDIGSSFQSDLKQDHSLMQGRDILNDCDFSLDMDVSEASMLQDVKDSTDGTCTLPVFNIMDAQNQNSTKDHNNPVFELNCITEDASEEPEMSMSLVANTDTFDKSCEELPGSSWNDDFDWEDDLSNGDNGSDSERDGHENDCMEAISISISTQEAHAQAESSSCKDDFIKHEEHASDAMEAISIGTQEEDHAQTESSSCNGHANLEQKETISHPQDRLENPLDQVDEEAEAEETNSVSSSQSQQEEEIEVKEEERIRNVEVNEPRDLKNDNGEESGVNDDECSHTLPQVCQESLETSHVEISHAESIQDDATAVNVTTSNVNDLSFYQKEQIRSEKIAQSQAEDLLNVTLALQQMEEAFKLKEDELEQMNQDLRDERAKTSSLTLEVERQNSEMDDMKDECKNEIKQLNVELSKSQNIAKSAEEDAQEALDLAKENDEKRQEMETLLQRALDEMDFLRNQAKALPMITEENHEGEGKRSIFSASEREEENSIPSYINQVDNTRLSAGRNLLRQAMNSSCDNDDISSASSTQDGSISSRTSSSSYLLDLTRKAADKRRKLRSRLSTGEESNPVGGNGVVCYSSSSHGQMDLAFVGALNKTCKSVLNLITKSGKTLNLGGRWFNSSSSASSLKSKGKKGKVEQSELEPMARSYCKSVEAVIARQKEQVNELRLFCEYLEHKVAIQRDDTGS